MSCKCFLALVMVMGWPMSLSFFMMLGSVFTRLCMWWMGLCFVAVLELRIQRFQPGAYLADGAHVGRFCIC